MVENGWTELVEKYERAKKRLALFEATRVEDALARLREPDIDNDGGPGNIAEAVECLLYNNKQFGYDLVELGEKYDMALSALDKLAGAADWYMDHDATKLNESMRSTVALIEATLEAQVILREHVEEDK